MWPTSIIMGLVGITPPGPSNSENGKSTEARTANACICELPNANARVFAEHYISADPQAMRVWEGWQKRFVADLPKGSIVIDPPNDRSPAEGMGYNMYFLTTTMADQPSSQKKYNNLLSGLDNYFRKENGLYRWAVGRNGDPLPVTASVLHPEASATDADIYIAASLVYAHCLTERNVWKSEGQPDYRARAQELMDAIQANEIIKKGNRLIIRPTDDNWPIWNDGRVVFNPSYFSPSNLRVISAADANPDHDWEKVLRDNYEIMNSIVNSKEKLSKGPNPFPDWVLVSVSKGAFRIGNYNHVTPDRELDAIRVPVELGRDVILNNDATSKKLIEKMIQRSGVRDDSIKVIGGKNEYGFACWGIAIKAAGDPYGTITWFSGALRSSMTNDYFGFTPNDAADYYKQSVVLLAAPFVLAAPPNAPANPTSPAPK